MRRRRAARHAALADPLRLKITEMLMVSDLASAELRSRLGVSSNLLAHHLGALERPGLVSRRRSEGDRRRSYVRLEPAAWEMLGAVAAMLPPERLVFVCTGNSARSPFAAGLWNTSAAKRRAGAEVLPASSAGTCPAAASEMAVSVARKYGVDLASHTPRRVEGLRAGDLVIAVCDRAHEQLSAWEPPRGNGWRQHHWSVPNPGGSGTQSAYEASFEELTQRLTTLARII